MSMHSSVLSAIGRTPLIELHNMYGRPRGIRFLAKLEFLNPGGSSKDRPSLRMIDQAWNTGLIGPGSVIIESSSGNTAISLAAVCALRQLRFVCVVDPRTAAANLQILKAYGVEIDRVTEPDPETGEFLPARLNRIRQLLSQIPGSYWPNQYENENNFLAQKETMREIIDGAGKVDYLFGGVSTCGTMLGCSMYVRESALPTRIVAVDAEGSAILGGSNGVRRFPGLGAGIVPPFGRRPFWDEGVTVSDSDMISGCRRLAKREGMLVGPSSGGVLSAVRRLLPRIPDDSVCAVILHDRGERYLDTVFSDEWVHSQLGLSRRDEKEDLGCST